jgi:hypothetical protein
MDERNKDAEHTEDECGNGMFDMRMGLGNEMGNTRDQEEDPSGSPHEDQEDASPEKGLLLHDHGLLFPARERATEFVLSAC